METEFARLMNGLGHLTHRVIGSGAAYDAVCDAVSILGNKTCLVEIKKADKVFYFGKRERRQVKRLVWTARQHRVKPLLAIRFKHRGWNLIEPKSFSPIKYDKNKRLRLEL